MWIIDAFVFVVALLSATVESVSVNKFREKYKWAAVDYQYPNQESQYHALNIGDYIPENNLPVGVERWKDKLFITVPRWKDGVPSTLNYVPVDSPEVSPKLIPYPDWASNRAGDCENGLTTVYRLKADKCDRLWILDVGTYGIGNTTKQLCPYSISVFDLNTDTRIRRYVFRPEDTNANTFIASIAIDMGASCEDTYAYMSDELGYGLVVYSWKENTSWRFNHGFFMPDPLAGDFNVAGLNYQWSTEGVFGMSVTPPGSDGYPTLLFNPLASNSEFAVSTKILRDKTRVEDSFHDFKYLGTRGPNGHVTSTVMDKNGVLFYDLVDQNAIGCWNSKLPYKPENHAVVDRDDVGLVFPCDVKIDEYENLWAFSDRMPVFLESEAGLDYSQYNFFLYVTTLKEAVAGTICDDDAYNAKVIPVSNSIYADTSALDRRPQVFYPSVNTRPLYSQRLVYKPAPKIATPITEETYTPSLIEYGPKIDYSRRTYTNHYFPQKTSAIITSKQLFTLP